MPATPSTNNPAVRRPRCKHCRKQFKTTSAVKVYCALQCQRDATKKKRRVSRVDRALGSAFMYHLAYECERATTLEILRGHTVTSLVTLCGVYKLRLKANQYGSVKDFEISHIAPVKGHDTIGLYCAENLVVSPTKFNRDHGTTHYAHGRSIPRSTLQSRHTVEKGASRKATVARIIKYLGADVVEEVVRIAKIQSTPKAKLVSWLRDNLNPSIEQHRTWLESLDEMKPMALKALKAKIEGKDAKDYAIKTRTFSAIEVLLTELSRHVAHRPDLVPVQMAVRSLMGTFFSSWTNLHYHSTQYLVGILPDNFLTEPQLQALFDCLHGKPAETFLQAIGASLPGAELVPARSPAILLAVLPVPTSAAVTFADELDTVFVPDIVPVLLQAHSATRERSDASYDTDGRAERCDPVPW